MNLEQIITEALPMAETWAPSQATGLRQLAAELRKETLKITVLGDFKAGKSTLLNRLFLRQSLLPTAVAESTAIPTILRSGEPCLQLMKRESNGQERVVETLTTIDAETLAAHLTAESESKRLELSQRYTHAVLSMPGILPKGLSLVDTPGLNTTNVGIMANSLWEAHDADAVLYVVRGKQLSQREAELIAEISGSQQSKIPFFVVVTADGSQSEGQLELICREIRAELSLRDIPCSCSIFFLDGTVCRSLQGLAERIFPQPGGIMSPSLPLSTIGAMLQGINSLLFGGRSSEASPADHALREELQRFFKYAVSKGHYAKIARELLPLLCTLQSAVSYRLELGAADAEKLAQAERTLRFKESEYHRTVSNLLGDIRAAQINFVQRSCDSVREVKTHLVEELESKQEVSAILQEMVGWQEKFPREVTHAVEREIITLEKDMRLLREKYQVDLNRQLPEAKEYTPEYDAGVIGKVPAWLLTVVDYLIFDAISPLPLIADMGVRYLISGTRFEKWMPANIACRMARSVAAQKAEELAMQVADNIRARMEMNFAELNTKLNDDFSGTSPFAGEADALELAHSSLLTPEQERELRELHMRIGIMKSEL